MRMLAVAMALLGAAMLAGCGGDDGGDETPERGGTTAAASDSTRALETASPGQSATASATPASRATGSGEKPPIPGDDAAEDAFRAIDYPDDMTDGYSLGSADADIVLTVYEDFQCPFCLAYSLIGETTVITEYVYEGTVRLEFRNLPILGGDSVNAAIASECAAQQDLFWPFHKELFLAQHEAGQLEDEQLNIGRFNAEELLRHGAAAGVEAETFETCLYAAETGPAVSEHVIEAQSLGLRSTPSVLVNGEPLASTPGTAEAWRELLDELLDKS
jgi:protein-disulfide isomerase